MENAQESAVVFPWAPPHLSLPQSALPNPQKVSPGLPRGLFPGWDPGSGSPGPKDGPLGVSPPVGSVRGAPRFLCALLSASLGFSYSPDLHSPGEGELRRSRRETVVSRVRAMPASRRRESPVFPLPSGGSAHLEQRHDRLCPGDLSALREGSESESLQP